MKPHLLCTALVWASLNMSAWSAAPICPEVADIAPQMLSGRWQIDWRDEDRSHTQAPWVIELGPHPEYAGSLKGTLRHGPQHHAVVADWDDDSLTMEESEDGVHIAATWQASLSPGQCGRELQGVRFTGSEPDASARRFKMRRDDVWPSRP